MAIAAVITLGALLQRSVGFVPPGDAGLRRRARVEPPRRHPHAARRGALSMSDDSWAVELQQASGAFVEEERRDFLRRSESADAVFPINRGSAPRFRGRAKSLRIMYV